MHRKTYKILIAVCLWAIFNSCIKDSPSITNSNSNTNTSGVFVICEGNFGNGDGSLYWYDINNKTASGDLYLNNNGKQLGDVFQSMSLVGSKYWLCVNNSNKIVILDTSTLKEIATIPVKQPRYLSVGANNAVYISTLYNNKVYIANSSSYTITDSVLLPTKNTEGMLVALDKVFLSSWDTSNNYIYQLSSGNHTIEKSILVAGYAPQAILLDKYNTLWVLSGNKVKGKNASLTHIDPSTGAIIKSFQFPSNADPIKPVMNPSKDTIYYIEVNYNGQAENNGIYKMGISATTLPEDAFISTHNNQYFWALGIAPGSGNIYVGDSKGFTQKGNVFIYTNYGIKLDSFKCGIGPSQFLFK